MERSVSLSLVSVLGLGIALGGLTLARGAAADEVCTPNGDLGCLVVQVLNEENAGVAVCTFSDAARTIRSPIGRATDANGRVGFQLLPGRKYWLRARKDTTENGVTTIGGRNFGPHSVAKNQTTKVEVTLTTDGFPANQTCKVGRN